MKATEDLLAEMVEYFCSIEQRAKEIKDCLIKHDVGDFDHMQSFVVCIQSRLDKIKKKLGMEDGQ